MPNKMAKIAPSNIIPMDPKGETSYKRVNDIRLALQNIGVGETDKRIGANDIDTKIEIKANSMKDDGSAKLIIT